MCFRHMERIELWRFHRIAGETSGPCIPRVPASVDDLSNGQEGVIYFKTSTPFDLDVLLGDPSLGIPTTDVGTSILPKTSTPTRSSAMVLLHGSGGISPGREME